MDLKSCYQRGIQKFARMCATQYGHLQLILVQLTIIKQGRDTPKTQNCTPGQTPYHCPHI
uniref:Hexosyltransferase n=1 Tax=Rhizophora mucronata TaxID=61149 RepID=A0A2P2KKC7_RHIMU